MLANLYMLNFDQQIHRNVNSIGGIYRRYSDDMVVICSAGHEAKIVQMFEKEIAERELDIQASKTQIFEFIKTGEKYICRQKYGEHVHPYKNFEYLGFEFDGHSSFIKSASVAGFYRKMKRAVFKGAFYSKVDKSKGGIFRSRLYRKFSYKGASRKRVYRQDSADASKWIVTHKYNWGNFISYARLAQNKLPNNKIKGQVRRHWNILNQLIAEKLR